MKLSLLIAGLVLAAAGLLGRHQQARLDLVRETHRQTLAEARALGLAVDGDDAARPPPPARRARESTAGRSAAAKSFAATLIAFAGDLRALQEAGDAPDAAMQQRLSELLGTLGDLDAGQVRVLVDELRASTALDDELRQGIVGLAIMTLAKRRPEAALALLGEAADLIDPESGMPHVAASCLQKLAETDPAAALDWLRAQRRKHPGPAGGHLATALLAGAAKHDPQLALDLLDELGLHDPGTVAGTLAAAAGSAAERRALLAALRGSPGRNDELVRATLGALAAGLARDGFAEASTWLAAAELDADETARFIDGLPAQATGDDTGRWLDWMAGKLSPERTARKVPELMERWTLDDPRAAGRWLDRSAEGPLKEAALAAHARTLAPYDPAAAAHRALDLPAGAGRAGLLAEILAEWRRHDGSAAAVFARDQGLGE